MFALSPQKSFVITGIIALFIFMFAVPQYASAQSVRDDLSVSEIRSLFNELLDRVLKLQSQVRTNSALDVGAENSVDDSVRVVETVVPVGTSSGTICPFSWTRTLHVGDTGSDVKRLQQFLNSDPDTRITGVFGGPGNETEYYGVATADAVARFQEKYKSSILTPVGLSQGSGYFGGKTREYINRLCAGDGPANSSGDLSVSRVPGNIAAVKATFTISPCSAYTINWGDGTTDEEEGTNSDTCVRMAAIKTINHTYSKSGTYTITLKSGSRTDTVQIKISLEGDDSDMDELSVVNVSGGQVRATFSIGSPCSAYTVNWGDGMSDTSSGSGINCIQVVTSKTLNHTYTKSGTYTVTLKTGSRTETDTVRVTVALGDSDNDIKVAASAAGSLVTASISLNVKAEQQSGLNLFCGITKAGTITWGDGTSDSISALNCRSGTQSFSLPHRYSSAGTYTIRVTDAAGKSASTNVTVTQSGSGLLNAIGGGTSSSGSSSGGSSPSSSGSGQNCLAAIGC